MDGASVRTGEILETMLFYLAFVFFIYSSPLGKEVKQERKERDLRVRKGEKTTTRKREEGKRRKKSGE